MKNLLLAMSAWLMLHTAQAQLDPSAFVTTWRTTGDNESFTIPALEDTNNDGTVDENDVAFSYSVDWGDGSTDTNVYTGPASHTYSVAGDYQISITGTFPRIRCKAVGEQIQSIDQWGDIKWENMYQAFFSCTNLIYAATDAPDLSNVTDLGSMFGYSTKFNGDLSNWDVSGVTDMSGMFAGTSFNSDLNTWDVSSVTDMGHMFVDASSFKSDVSSWDVSSVTTMIYMFYNATSFNGDVSSWDVSSVTKMDFMFYNATSFNSDLNNWDVSKVTSMGEMFSKASSFNGDLSSWDLSAVNNLWKMFYNASLSMTNYDKLLEGWSTLDEGETKVPTYIDLGTVSSTYCQGEAARTRLIDEYGWSIAGDEKACPPAADLAALPELVACDEMAELTAPTADNGTITGQTTTTFPITTLGENTIQWVFTSAKGKESVQTQIVWIGDYVVPDTHELADVSGVCSVASLVLPTATSGCGGEITGVHDATLPITETTTVTWTYTSESDESATQTQKVVIAPCVGSVTSVAPDQTASAIYPNPATNSFQLSGLPADELTLVDMNGKVLSRFESPQTSYYIGSLEAGIYTVMIRFGQQVRYTKLLKR
ncbi:BspA family leucine-rich repeat surface protein [Reichenbachiella carrageenanivorans]|uniref:BspA family leucine-rich repeat surface protein n=1 Tax=Reichenbachiella carrageenanivorans TaxID=2979869 RepID=A0ABY6D3E6_9BACT|nr:BspA family leucine-rich repeat surface protein [Reichenbachiella carrageenanivorans]UXX80682.1 BspA family leucine-rich repeat surface protein [Reichenbachiella carrageenanivorans]